jgi:extradiol dioxygenase family protein
MRDQAQGIQGRLAAGDFVKPLTSPQVAVPVRDLAEARRFYQQVLGCLEGHGDADRIHFSLFGCPIVCHLSSQCGQHRITPSNAAMVRKAVPVPLFSVVLDRKEWHSLIKRLRRYRAEFNIAPCIRFSGAQFEEASLSVLDPSGNALEFRSCPSVVGPPARHGRKTALAALSVVIVTAAVWCWILLLAQKSAN